MRHEARTITVLRLVWVFHHLPTNENQTLEGEGHPERPRVEGTATT
jgi:hypothetical protein